MVADVDRLSATVDVHHPDLAVAAARALVGDPASVRRPRRVLATTIQIEGGAGGGGVGGEAPHVAPVRRVHDVDIELVGVLSIPEKPVVLIAGEGDLGAVGRNRGLLVAVYGGSGGKLLLVC